MKNIFYYSLLFLSTLFLNFNCQPSEKAHSGEHTYTNKLIDQSSPYLLQHAHNPVNWRPWGEEALEKAKAENKLIIISIGYAACHWCHVMEHESFEDTTVARIMNDNFITVKVDREERPDVDDVYMTACQLATRRGCGWPLNAFALPNGQPVWAGTYFPKDRWLEILDNFKNLWQDDPTQLEDYAKQLTEGVQNMDDISLKIGEQEFSQTKLDAIANNFLNNIDLKKGGRKGAPKFPLPSNWDFLLKYNHLTGNENAQEAAFVTLDNMANGGIYDHLGGGFARYSVDGNWLVPHFEKMLYDNGQLVSLYAKAWQHSKDPLYKKTVEETLDFIKRRLTDKEGGFYSSLDADSDGEEGKFYVWTKGEIDSLINDETKAEVFNAYYEISEKGNWEHHKNILHRKKEVSSLIAKFKISEEALNLIIVEGKKILFNARDQRTFPGLDDKVLTAWNALMLKGYTDAYKAFGKKEYLDAALKNGTFMIDKMLQKDGRLNRNYKDGKSVINAFLDDYALTIQAFTGLYEITFDEKWLYKAKELANYAIIHFFDEETGMFNYTSDLDPPLVARKMEISDNVIPGSNSSMARSLYLLGLYFYNTEFLDKSSQMLHNVSETIETIEQPNFYANWCILYLDMVAPPYEVAVVGDNFETIRNGLMKNYIPNAILLGGKDEGTLELLKDKLQEGETMIYVCQNKVCKMPVTEVEKALTLMD